MPRELDAAIGAAHEMTRHRVVKTAAKPAVKVPEKKVGAPTVKVDKSGHRVRLRNIDHALEGCVSSRGGEQRFRLEPNQWTVVSDDVYTMLKSKFYKPQVFESVDWNTSATDPQRTVRKEEYQEYIIEFPEEHD